MRRRRASRTTTDRTSRMRDRLRGLFVLLVPALLALPATSVLADIYVYVDEQGRVFFTDIKKSDKYRLFLKEGETEAREKVTIVGSYSLSEVTDEEIDRKIRVAADRYRMDRDLIRAVVKAESNFDPGAVSTAGARGLMQIMPALASRYGVTDIHDPDQNLNAGVRHLKELMDYFKGDLPMALAAYNAGITAVINYKGIPPYGQTRDYIRKVLIYYDAYRKEGR